jgi:hypothetical protein
LPCHLVVNFSFSGRHATAVCRLGEKARLRPDPAELVMYVGRAVARRGTVVVLPEDIDLINATRIAEQLTLAVGHGTTTVIDMTATTFCDCAGACHRTGSQACHRQRRRAAPDSR